MPIIQRIHLRGGDEFGQLLFTKAIIAFIQLTEQLLP